MNSIVLFKGRIFFRGDCGVAAMEKLTQRRYQECYDRLKAEFMLNPVLDCGKLINKN